MQPSHSTPSPDLVEQYRRQMMALYAQTTPEPPPEENWLEQRFPPPDIMRDKAAITLSEEDANPPAPEPPSIAETPFVGYLRVFVFTGDKAEPVPGALAVVTKNDTLYANTITDRDGYTQVIPLPSVNPEMTLSPGVQTPYVTYDVLVTAEGFYPVRHENVPVYGNNYVTQPVVLLSIVPGTNPNAVRDFTSGGPTNL